MGRASSFFRDHGLSLALFGLFAIFQLGLSIVGQLHYNEELREHGRPVISYFEYLGSAAFMEATMENWESEFLQMAAYVVFTVFLFQRGSSESKDPDKDEEVDREADSSRPNAPWPVRRGGIVLRLYEHSLSIALLSLFLLSFVLHAASGARLHSQEELMHGGEPISTIEYLGTSQFWFESLQNWQSEFLSIGVMVVLSIFLREKGSPESKPVDSQHWQTGD